VVEVEVDVEEEGGGGGGVGWGVGREGRLGRKRGGLCTFLCENNLLLEVCF
jgi:hypothetical protein